MASAAQDLDLFVRDALQRGRSRASIEKALMAAGWEPEQARAALAACAEVDFAVPVPRPRPYLSAREAFLYLVMFTTLYLSAYHLGALLFELINRRFPDPSMFYAGACEQHPLVGGDDHHRLSDIFVAFCKHRQ